MRKVPEQLSAQRVLAFATVVGIFAFVSAPAVSLSLAIAQQQTATTNTTTTGGIPETVDLPERQQRLLMMVTADNEPLYQSISGNLTSTRIVEVVSPSVVMEEESFIERAVMKDIGNVTNTGTYVENIDYNRGTVQGVGKGIITTEDGGGRDRISWNAYDLGLLLLYGYGNGDNNFTGTDNESASAGAGLNNTERITTYRGIVFFKTDSERLSFMDNVIGLYITQVNNENGTSLRQIWEWRDN